MNPLEVKINYATSSVFRIQEAGSGIKYFCKKKRDLKPRFKEYQPCFKVLFI
jgi:hypothetical protein